VLIQHIQQRSRNLFQWKRVRSIRSPEVAQGKAGESRMGNLLDQSLVKTYQITASGLHHLEQQLSSFERMFEDIALVLDASKATTN
jgi:hypothetical protein